MKNLIVYWIIGCVAMGFPIAALITDCPKDKIESSEIVSIVAVWPIFFVMAIARTGKPPLERGCRVAP